MSVRHVKMTAPLVTRDSSRKRFRRFRVSSPPAYASGSTYVNTPTQNETWNASSSKRAVATSISASASHRFRSSHTSEWYLPAPRATARSLSEKSIPHTRLSSPASTPALLRLSACKPSAHPTSKTRAPRFGRRTAPARIARTNASVASSGQRYPHSRTVRL